eukprot:CAMPEP_0115152934 /NCGR_PEP_ID=MMETSP0227-20121206/66438_1 /TAXON_ID=89957 /ORGANISM="Polarella glacialis, Strain CCMP 1383" /LENGTH=254 /DNA_ID=CAMNT_0002563601 /DNA_START=116 /DNA_END=881 /DNA_ORIENTATION=-
MTTELSDSNKGQVQRFISYFKGKRERLLAEREAEKAEFVSDRLSDDQAIFNKTDVEDMLDTYHAHVVGTIREALEGFVNLSAVYVAQVLQRAEQYGVSIEGDISAIEDQHRVDEIAQLAAQGFVPLVMNKKGSLLGAISGVQPAPPSPSGGGIGADFAAAARVQELESENHQMRDRYQTMQQQVSDLLRERSQLGAGGPRAAERLVESTQFQEMKAIVRKKTDEVKLLRTYISSAGLEPPGTEGGGFELVAEDD